MSNIKDLCKDVLFNRISNWMNLNGNKLYNAKRNLGVNNEEIVLFYDSSLFENGKTGLALCESGIYWKDSFFASRYLTWDSIRKTKLTYDKNNIYFGDKGSFWLDANDVENLVMALHNIRTSIKVENFVEKTTGFFGFVKEAINFINELDTGNDTNINSNITTTTNEQYMLEDSSNQIENNTNQTQNNKIVDVSYETQNNKNSQEEIIEEIKSVKGFLTYLNKDFIGDLAKTQVNNSEDLDVYIFEAAISAATLTGDKDLLPLFDEDIKKNLFELKGIIDPQVELIEDTLNSDIVSTIGEEKISLKKAINLYNHRVKVIMEEYEDEYEIEEIYDSIQDAIKDFRKTLKTMLKYCNTFIEKIYTQA